MPSAILLITGCAALVAASAALAQQAPGGGVRARPGRPLVDIRNDFVEESRRTEQNLEDQLAALTPEQRARVYLDLSERHRAQAQAMARLAQCGAAFPPRAAVRIREALRFDLHAWRVAYQVSGPDWQAVRNAWLVERGALTAAQWAERRALWFRERDAWIAGGQLWAGALRPAVQQAPPPVSEGRCAALAMAASAGRPVARL